MPRRAWRAMPSVAMARRRLLCEMNIMKRRVLRALPVRPYYAAHAALRAAADAARAPEICRHDAARRHARRYAFERFRCAHARLLIYADDALMRACAFTPARCRVCATNGAVECARCCQILLLLSSQKDSTRRVRR